MVLAISCSSDSFLSLFKVIASFVTFLYYLIPLGLIIYGMIDFAKVVMSEKVDNGAALKLFVKKIIAVVLVMIIVPIVVLVLEIVNSAAPITGTVKTCTDVILNGLLNPSSIDVPNISEETDSSREFKDKCNENGGHYGKVSVDLYHEELDVIDTFNDGTYVHICTRGSLQ